MAFVETGNNDNYDDDNNNNNNHDIDKFFIKVYNMFNKIYFSPIRFS